MVEIKKRNRKRKEKENKREKRRKIKEKRERKKPSCLVSSRIHKISGHSHLKLDPQIVTKFYSSEGEVLRFHKARVVDYCNGNTDI